MTCPDIDSSSLRTVIDSLVEKAVEVSTPLSCEKCLAEKAVFMLLIAAQEIAVTHGKPTSFIEGLNIVMEIPDFRRSLGDALGGRMD